MSEKYYKKLQLLKIHLLQNISERSATGSNLAPIRLVKTAPLCWDCYHHYNSDLALYVITISLEQDLNTFMLGGRSFNSDFIQCNHIAMRYSKNGKCILDHQQQELIAAMGVEIRPHMSLTNSISLPGRTLAVIHVNNNLSQEQSGHLYEIEPNYLLTNEYPNLYIIPTIHNVDLHKT